MFITFVDDVFPEGPEQLELFLSAAPGALIVSPAHASVTILNDDPPLPGMLTKVNNLAVMSALWYSDCHS